MPISSSDALFERLYALLPSDADRTLRTLFAIHQPQTCPDAEEIMSHLNLLPDSPTTRKKLCTHLAPTSTPTFASFRKGFAYAAYHGLNDAAPPNEDDADALEVGLKRMRQALEEAVKNAEKVTPKKQRSRSLLLSPTLSEEWFTPTNDPTSLDMQQSGRKIAGRAVQGIAGMMQATPEMWVTPMPFGTMQADRQSKTHEAGPSMETAKGNPAGENSNAVGKRNISIGNDGVTVNSAFIQHPAPGADFELDDELNRVERLFQDEDSDSESLGFMLDALSPLATSPLATSFAEVNINDCKSELRFVVTADDGGQLFSGEKSPENKGNIPGGDSKGFHAESVRISPTTIQLDNQSHVFASSHTPIAVVENSLLSGSVTTQDDITSRNLDLSALLVADEQSPDFCSTNGTIVSEVKDDNEKPHLTDHIGSSSIVDAELVMERGVDLPLLMSTGEQSNGIDRMEGKDIDGIGAGTGNGHLPDVTGSNLLTNMEDAKEQTEQVIAVTQVYEGNPPSLLLESSEESIPNLESQKVLLSISSSANRKEDRKVEHRENFGQDEMGVPEEGQYAFELNSEIPVNSALSVIDLHDRQSVKGVNGGIQKQEELDVHNEYIDNCKPTKVEDNISTFTPSDKPEKVTERDDNEKSSTKSFTCTSKTGILESIVEGVDNQISHEAQQEQCNEFAEVVCAGHGGGNSELVSHDFESVRDPAVVEEVNNEAMPHTQTVLEQIPDLTIVRLDQIEREEKIEARNHYSSPATPGVEEVSGVVTPPLDRSSECNVEDLDTCLQRADNIQQKSDACLSADVLNSSVGNENISDNPAQPVCVTDMNSAQLNGNGNAKLDLGDCASISKGLDEKSRLDRISVEHAVLRLENEKGWDEFFSAEDQTLLFETDEVTQGYMETVDLYDKKSEYGESGDYLAEVKPFYDGSIYLAPETVQTTQTKHIAESQNKGKYRMEGGKENCTVVSGSFASNVAEQSLSQETASGLSIVEFSESEKNMVCDSTEWNVDHFLDRQEALEKAEQSGICDAFGSETFANGGSLNGVLATCEFNLTAGINSGAFPDLMGTPAAPTPPSGEQLGGCPSTPPAQIMGVTADSTCMAGSPPSEFESPILDNSHTTMHDSSRRLSFSHAYGSDDDTASTLSLNTRDSLAVAVQQYVKDAQAAAKNAGRPGANSEDSDVTPEGFGQVRKVRPGPFVVKHVGEEMQEVVGSAVSGKTLSGVKNDGLSGNEEVLKAVRECMDVCRELRQDLRTEMGVRRKRGRGLLSVVVLSGLVMGAAFWAKVRLGDFNNVFV